MKVITWVALVALVTCLVFPPIVFAWVIALVTWWVFWRCQKQDKERARHIDIAQHRGPLHQERRSALLEIEEDPSIFRRERLSETNQLEAAIHEADTALGGFTEIQQAYVDVFMRSKQILDESLQIAEDTKDELTRSSRLEIARQQLDNLEALAQDKNCILSLSNADEIRKDYYRLLGVEGDWNADKPIDLEAFMGKPWGEIVAEMTGGANLVDGKQTWELADEFKHDLPKMLECCTAELRTMEQAGQIPAPYYFERAAILLRKAKQHQSEVQLIELYLSAIDAWNEAHKNKRPGGAGSRHDKIVQRLTKAKQLADKYGNIARPNLPSN